MTLRDKLFGFRGRIRRTDWWWLGILIGIVQTIATVAVSALAMAANLIPEMVTPFAGGGALPFYLSMPLQLAFLWPTLALSAQRYHDRGHSAWPVFLYFGALYGLDFLPAAALGWMTRLDPIVQQTLNIGWAVIWLGLAIWLLVVLGFLDGTKGPNRFGPSPKGVGGGEDEAVASTFD